MAPREGNSIVKHGVLDERLNVHGVQGLKVADVSAQLPRLKFPPSNHIPSYLSAQTTLVVTLVSPPLKILSSSTIQR